MSLFVFDLGNVVIRTDFSIPGEVWSRYCGRTAKELLGDFRIDNEFESFECGRMSSRDYHGHFNRLLGIDLTFNEFVEGWNAIYQGLFEQVIVAVRRLKNEGRVVALTNTNEVHCDVWPRLYPTLLDLFETIYISNEVGLRKPDPALFKLVLEREAMKPADTVFFDDNAENVAAARALGIRSVLVASPEDVVRAIP